MEQMSFSEIFSRKKRSPQHRWPKGCGLGISVNSWGRGICWGRGRSSIDCFETAGCSPLCSGGRPGPVRPPGANPCGTVGRPYDRPFGGAGGHQGNSGRRAGGPRNLVSPWKTNGALHGRGAPAEQGTAGQSAPSCGGRDLLVSGGYDGEPFLRG